MKKFIPIAAVCILIFQVSCSQEKQLKAMKQFKKVMIVDINTNVIIPWAGDKKKDSSSGSLKSFGKITGLKKLESSAADAEDLLNQTTKKTIEEIGKTILRDLTASQIFLFVPYASADQTKISRESVYGKYTYEEDRARPAGYKSFDPSKKNVTKTCSALGIDAIIIVKTDYKRVVSFGNQVKNGTMYVTATMEMSVYDRGGERLWSNITTQESSDTFAVLNGVYNTEKHDKAVISATENAGKFLFNDLKKRMSKI